MSLTPREQGALLATTWGPLTDEQIESAARILATVEARRRFALVTAGHDPGTTE